MGTDEDGWTTFESTGDSHRLEQPPAPPPAPPLPAPAPPTSDMPAWPSANRAELYVGLGAAAVVVIGAFLPWLKLATVFGDVSRSGVDDGGDGLVTAGAAVLGGLALWQARRWLWASIAAAILIVGLGVWDMADVNGRVDEINADAEGAARASIGAGLYATVAGGLVFGLVAIRAVQRRRRARTAAALA